METIEPLLRGLAERYTMNGSAPVSAVWTDKCCADRPCVQRVATSSFVGCDMSDDKIIDYSDTHYVLHGFKSSNEAIEALLVPHGRHSFIAAALHCAAHLASAPLIFLRPDSTPHLF